MIIIILIIGLVLRLISINQSFWLDEATTANVARNLNLQEIITKFAPGDFHPPLYYLVIKVWGGIFGVNEVSLRTFSVLCGLGTIYIVYKLAGKIPALLLATSGLFIYYSQEARMYAFTAFLVALLIFLFTKILQKKTRLPAPERSDGGQARVEWWGVFAIILAAIAATDYVAILILPALWIYAKITNQSSVWKKKLLMSHIILVVFGLLWLPTFFKQFGGGLNAISSSPAWVSVLGNFSFKEIFLIPVKFIIGRVSVENKWVYGGGVGVVASVYGYLIIKSLPRLKKLFYLWLTVPLILALIISIKIPVLNYFRFLFVLPAFYIVIAKGITKKWILILILAINLVTSLAYLTNPRFQREDWRGFAQKLEHKFVVFPSDSQREAFLYYLPNFRVTEVNDINSNNRELWLVRYAQPISDPEDKARTKIEDLGFKKTGEVDFNGVVAWKYSR